MHNVVYEVLVTRVMADYISDISEAQVESVVITGVVDDRDIGYNIVLDTAPTIAIYYVIDYQGGRRICSRGGISPIAKIDDYSISIRVIFGAVVRACDSIVGNNVMQSCVTIKPLIAVEGDSASTSRRCSRCETRYYGQQSDNRNAHLRYQRIPG
jgi:hypothetical protein